MNLRLLQITDSALPIGGYTHSWGLEAAIARGVVHDPETLERWTGRWLRLALGPFEGAVVAASGRAALGGDREGLIALNQMVDASMPPPSIRRASREMGDQLLGLGSTWAWSSGGLGALRDDRAEGWHHSVAFGIMGALAGAQSEDVLTAYLHQAALGMIGAGVRAIPVGHTHGQQILAYLHDTIDELAGSIGEGGLETAGAGCPSYEILCDEQTRLYSRVFRC